MIKAKLFVPSGAPDQLSGGETLSPSIVYFFGSMSPSEKEEDTSDLEAELEGLKKKMSEDN